MSTHRTSLAANAARIVLGGLTLVLLIALLASVFLSRGPIDDAEAEAETRAVDWTNTALFDALTPEQVQEPILGPDYRELLIIVQAGIRSDDRTARVRIWNADGVLVFSDDQRDKIGEYVATDNPQIGTALSGETVSVPTQATVAPKSGLAGSDEKLFQTFVPLRLEDQLGISGVAQIDQRYAAIESEASNIWQTIRLGLVIALTVVVGLFLFTLRARPAPAGVEEAVEGASPRRQDRRALERATKAEDQLRIMTERAEAAEAVVAAAEGTVEKPIARLREFEERAARAEERAGDAEAALQEAAQRMTGGEAPRRGVPGVGAVAVSATAGDLEATLVAVQAERERFNAELGRVRAALTERDAELALAREGASTGGAEVEKVQADQATADELRTTQLQVTDLQMKLTKARTALEQAQGKLLENETRPTGLDARVADLETAHARTTKELEAARAELAKADAELAAARQALAGKEQGTASAKGPGERTAVVEAALAEMEIRVREVETRATTAEARAAAAEAEDVETLRQRVAELEEARRADVTELQRAQEALANTQFESGQARRRVKELEERLEELQASPAAAAEQRPAPAVEESTTFAERFAHLVREHEPSTEAEPATEAEEVDESALSLRERLARAAAARHRTPGTPGSDP